MPRRRIALLVTLIALAAAGCGGDEDKPASDARPTHAEEPREGSTTQTGPPGAGAEPSRPAPPQRGTSGGARAPAPESRPPQDTPEHDVPPPPGSAAERFERACERNPALCE